MRIDQDSQMARYAEFERRTAPLERRAVERYDQARERLAAGDAQGAVSLLESAAADLAEAEAIQRELLPDLEGGSRERDLVEGVLRAVRARIAAGETGPWDAFADLGRSFGA